VVNKPLFQNILSIVLVCTVLLSCFFAPCATAGPDNNDNVIENLELLTGNDATETSHARIKQRLTSLGKGAGHQLHTILLLITIGGTEKIGHGLSTYLKTGNPDSLEDVFKELSGLATSTAISTELWSQMMGATSLNWARGLSLGITEAGLNKFTGKANIISGALKTQFLLRHALGYIGFFGWEFGRELFRAAQMDFAERIQSDNSKVNDVDVYRTESILELVSDYELMTEFLTSVFYVLSNDKELRRVFNTSARKWVSWDLVGTYSALSMGSYMGKGLGQITGTRAAGYLLGRTATSRIGAILGGSRAGVVGSVIGSFIGVVVFAVVKDIEPIRLTLVAMDRWTVLTPRKHFYNKAAENAITGLRHPNYGAGYWAQFKDSMGYEKIVKDLNLAKDRLAQFYKYRESVMSDHLALMAPYMVEILNSLSQYMSVPAEKRLFYETYVHTSRRNGRSSLLDKAFKELAPAAQKMTRYENELVGAMAMNHREWKIMRKEIIASANTSKEDLEKNLTVSRYIKILKTKLNMLKRNHPILLISAEHTLFPDDYLDIKPDQKYETVKMKLWHWLSSKSISDQNKKTALHYAIFSKRTELSKIETKINTVLDKLFGGPSEGYVTTFEDRDRIIRSDDKIMGSRLGQYVRNFNLRKSHFLYYNQDMTRYADRFVKGRIWRGFKDQSKVKTLVLDYQHRMHTARKAFDDLFAWDEYHFKFLQDKMHFILKWAIDGFDEELFLEKYKKFRESLDKQLNLERLMEAVSEIEVDIKALRKEFIKLKTKKHDVITLFKWLRSDGKEGKNIRKEFEQYVKDNQTKKIQAIIQRKMAEASSKKGQRRFEKKR